MRRGPFGRSIIALIVMAGCRPAGPASVRATSAQYPTLAARVTFLNQYVTFRRTYESLDFNVAYHNNDGLGSSDWDVHLVSTVPAAEIGAWLPAGVKPTTAPGDRAWLRTVPTSLNLNGVTEWYDEKHRQVGLDRANRIVVYRAWTL